MTYKLLNRVNFWEKLVTLKGDIKLCRNRQPSANSLYSKTALIADSELKLLEKSIQEGKSYGKYHWNQW
ncbi:MAG: hypothetical protein V7L25_06420 [Nostoc sp.]